jgi:hypothetical protein
VACFTRLTFAHLQNHRKEQPPTAPTHAPSPALYAPAATPGGSGRGGAGSDPRQGNHSSSSGASRPSRWGQGPGGSASGDPRDGDRGGREASRFEAPRDRDRDGARKSRWG